MEIENLWKNRATISSTINFLVSSSLHSLVTWDREGTAETSPEVAIKAINEMIRLVGTEYPYRQPEKSKPYFCLPTLAGWINLQTMQTTTSAIFFIMLWVEQIDRKCPFYFYYQYVITLYGWRKLRNFPYILIVRVRLFSYNSTPTDLFTDALQYSVSLLSDITHVVLMNGIHVNAKQAEQQCSAYALQFVSWNKGGLACFF